MAVLDTLVIETEVQGNAPDALQTLIELVSQLVESQKQMVAAIRSGNLALGEMTQGSEEAAKGTEEVTKATTKQNSALQILKENWKAIAALGIGRLLTGLVSDLTNQAVSLQQSSTALNVTTQGFQALHYAAEQSTVPIEAVDSALSSLQDTIRGAAMGNSDQMQSLGFLGLNGKSIGNMDAPARFSAVAESLSKISDPTRRAGVAMRVFGGSAQQMLPLLAQGREGIQKLTDEFSELGGGLSTTQIGALVDWDHQLSKIGVSWTRFRGLLAQAVLPVLKLVASGFQTMVKWLSDFNNQAKIMEYGGIAVMIAALFKLINLLRTAQALDLGKSFLNVGKWVAIAIIIAAVAAVVQDLIHAFRGGRSVIAEVIDKMLGLGKVDGWVRNIRAGWEAMSKLEFPGITEVMDAFISFYRGDELKGQITATKDALEAWNKEAAQVTDPYAKPLYARRREQLEGQLAGLENTYFGVRGLRAVTNGIGSDVQRSGEGTTGDLSRFNGGVGSVTVQNQIRVEQGTAGATGTAQAAQRGVSDAMSQSARQLQAISGGKRK